MTMPFDRRRFLKLQALGLSALALAPADLRAFLEEEPGSSPNGPPAPAELIAVVEAGDTAKVRAILAESPRLATARDGQNRSIFVLAYLAGHPQVAEVIRGHGIELDLVEAILADDQGRAEELAQAQAAQINDLHPIGGTPYYAVGLFGRKGYVFTLNRWGGDPNANPLGEKGMTAARAALECRDREAGRDTAMRILADAGDPAAPQKDGDSILHAAARHGDPHLVELVIRKGGDVTARNAKGETPLQVALASNNGEAVELLVNHGRIPRNNTSSRRAYAAAGRPYRPPADTGIDPLVVNEFSSVCHFNFDRVKELLREHPGLVHTNASWNEMGVEASAHMGRQDMVDYLLERGAPLSLPTAIMRGEIELAKKMLQKNPRRIHERGPHDFALMWYPEIAGGRVDLAELLLDHGANIDEHKLGVTVLHRAAHRGHLDLVKFLLEKGANTQAVGRSDFADLEGTPLDFARANEQEEAARLIEEYQARG